MLQLTVCYSYIIYIALLCMYLVLVIYFFPETRGLTIEEVSLIFDTGRLGNATAATAELRAHVMDEKGADTKQEKRSGSATHVEYKNEA